MDFVILPKYAHDGPSSRIRIHSVRENFEFDYKVSNYLPKRYVRFMNSGVYGLRFFKVLIFIFSGIRRAYFLVFRVRKGSRLWVEKELLHCFPYFIEFLIIKYKRFQVYLDYDDGVHVPYNMGTSFLWTFVFSGKIRRLVSLSRLTFVGSLRLATYMRRFSTNVVYLPNSVPRFASRGLRSQIQVQNMVWTGSPSTAWDLIPYRETLNLLIRDYRLRLSIIGSSYEQLGIAGVYFDWDPECEEKMLLCAGSGLNINSPTFFNMYKCSYKVSLYRAASLFVFTTPFCEESNLIDPEMSAFFTTPEGFFEVYISILNKSPFYIQQHYPRSALYARSTNDVAALILEKIGE